MTWIIGVLAVIGCLCVAGTGVRMIKVACCSAIVAISAMLLVTAGGAVSSASPISGFEDTVVFRGLVRPTAVRFSPDGRVFVAEKSGIIKVFDSLTDPTPTVFADLRTNVFNGYDRGLLGLALAPNFPTDPRVYVLYSYDAEIGGTAPKWGTPGATNDACPDPPGATIDGCVISGRLSVLTAQGDTMVGSENVLINDWCQQFQTHSVGDLMFGQDGMLYVTGGDGAGVAIDYGQKGIPLNPCNDPPAGVGGTETPPTAEGGALRAQDLLTPSDPTTLDGTLLRLDPNTGQAAPGNPLSSSTDANARRIVAYGLRNPYRFTIRPGTNDIWLGVVGASTWESIDHVPDPTSGPLNFGWPCYEGGHVYPGYQALNTNMCNTLYSNPSAVTPAWFSYRHDSPVAPSDTCPVGTSAVTGLAFYNGGSYPTKYKGALFFSDYARQCIWVAFKGANGLPNPATITQFDQTAGAAVDLEIGPGGDLYYVDIANGTINRVQYFAGNQPPIASVSATPTNGPVPLHVSFDATGSSDPDGDPISYSWDLNGDGQYGDSTSATPDQTYTTAGDVTVGLRVTDSQGASSVAYVVVHPGNTAPTATIQAPNPSIQWITGQKIAFSGSATDPEDGTLPASSLSWSVLLHHCYTPTNCHVHFIDDFPGVSGGSFEAPDHPYPSYLELQLTGTDSGGLSNTTSLLLYPQTVDLTFQGAPTGSVLTVNGAYQVTPFRVTAIVGSTVPVSAASQQTVDGTPYGFTGWSDGGASSHDISAPSSGTTYTATYAATGPPPLFSDRFESGNLQKWRTVNGLVVQGSAAYTGFFGARATDTSTLPAFAIAKLAQVSAAPNARIRFNIATRDPTKIVTLMTLRTSTNAPLLRVYLLASGRLAVRNFVQPSTVIASSIPVTFGAWHTLEVSLDLTTSPATLRVWLDSTSQPILSKTIAEPLATVGRLQIGDDAAGHPADVFYDDVVVSNAALH